MCGFFVHFRCYTQLPVHLLVKSSKRHQNGGRYKNHVNFDIKYEKNNCQSSQKKYFDAGDINDDVTAWLQNQPSIFMFQWNCHIFYNNSKIFWDMTSNLYAWMYHGFVTKDISDDDIIDKVKTKSKCWTIVTSLIFELESSKCMELASLCYLEIIPNSRYNFRLKSSLGPQNGAYFENFEIFKIGSYCH